MTLDVNISCYQFFQNSSFIERCIYVCVFRLCRKEMEDFIFSLVQKRLQECENDREGSHVKPHVCL